MKDWRIVVEVNLKKVLIAACIVLSVVLACKIGAGDVLLFIVPAGVACLISKEV